MVQNEFNNLLDKLIIKAASPEKHKMLTEKQQIVGAIEMLIGTTSRSGVEVFFNNDYRYLWNDALTGLEKLKADSSAKNYKIVLKDMKRNNFKNLQDSLMKVDFDILHNGVRKFIVNNPDIFE